MPGGSGRMADALDEVDELERLHLLGDAVFEHFEIVGGEIGDRRAVGRRGDDVNRDEVDAGTEGGLLGGCGGQREGNAEEDKGAFGHAGSILRAIQRMTNPARQLSSSSAPSAKTRISRSRHRAATAAG